jgi:hypothetical protein
VSPAATTIFRTTDAGTTIGYFAHPRVGTLVILDNPAAPADMRHIEAGRLTDAGFQPAPFAAYGMTAAVLRGIADLIEEGEANAKA